MGGERRLVTILYADVVGSTSLGEHLDPEDVHALMTRLFAHATQAVEGYGGTLEKFIGDAVFAVFGVPAAHGDDAARALHAALDLRDRVKSDVQLGARLPIRIGVNTGEVLVNPDRRRGDFIVVGDTVNVAARLQHAASPWQILCSDRTAKAAQDGFSFGDSEGYALPGRDGVVMATPLLERARSGAATPGPFVGREQDLDQLRLLLHRTQKENRPFLVTVAAESGVGKSRLLAEFAPLARDMGAGVLWTSAPPYGERLTYWPLRRLLTELLDLDVGAARDEILSGLAAWAARSTLTNELDQAVIAAALGLGEHEVEDRNAVHVAWTSVFAAAAADRPLVIIIEDLHWASDSVLDAIEHQPPVRAHSRLASLPERATALGFGARPA
jgi:class 3 adenylate cyclase